MQINPVRNFASKVSIFGISNGVNKLLLFVGLSLMTGFIWGYAIAPEIIYKDVIQHYSESQLPIGQYDEMVSMDVIRNGDDI